MRARSRRISLFVIMFAALFVVIFPALAQDKLTEKYTFESGAAFSYPDVWKLNKAFSPA